MTKTIISFIIIGISVYLIFGYVKPTFNEAEEIKVNTTQYDKALNKAKEIQQLKTTLLSNYNLFAGENLSKLEKLLPDHVDNVRLVLDIDGIASKRGIRISAVKVQKSEKNESDAQVASAVGFNSAATAAQPFQDLVLEFSTVATYDNFKLFLEDLEHSLRIVDLVSLDITQAQRPKENGPAGGVTQTDDLPDIYKFDVGIKTYWLK